MPDSKDGSAHLDGLAQDAPDAPREQQVPSATAEPKGHWGCPCVTRDASEDKCVCANIERQIIEAYLAPSLPD